MPRVKYRTKIPLVGNGRSIPDPPQVRRTLFEKVRQFADRGLILIKPQRRLGAPWIDNFVAQRKNVRLCLDCSQKYSGWDRQNGYRFTRNVRGDCMGCSTDWQSVYHYVPAEKYAAYWLR